MDDLREKLAERFADIFLARYGDGSPYATLNTWQREKWLEMADECIRQMEWARHECPFEWAGTPDPVTKAGSPDAILTPAPPDWRPDGPPPRQSGE